METVTLPILVPNSLQIGTALATTGLALRTWAGVYLVMAGGHSIKSVQMTVKPPKGWVRTGPYRFLQHPMYVGSLMFIAGLGCIALGWGGLLLALPSLPHYLMRMSAESTLIQLDMLSMKHGYEQREMMESE